MNLEDLFKQRELVNVITTDKEGHSLEVRYFDTGQLLIKGEETRLDGRLGQEKKTSFKSYITYGARTGSGTYVRQTEHGRSSGGISLTHRHHYCRDPLYLDEALNVLAAKKILLPKEPLGYPEVNDFTEMVHNAYKKWQLEPTIPAIFYVPQVAAGHGNIPPWALLHPATALKIFTGTIFPFQKKTGFDLARGQERIRKNAKVVTNPQESKYVALIRTGLFEKEQNKSFASTLHAYIFNYTACEEFLKNKRKLDNPFPDKDNTVFEIPCFFEYGQRSYHFYHHKFDAPDNGLLESKVGDVLLEIDESYVETLARIAPLPIHLLARDEQWH